MNSTPFPNYLIDEVMPTLKDTEWRVLCVIVRQTMGWKTPQSGQRKTRDWLSQSQLQARTGRATEALSRAIDTLVRRRLVEVWNDQGEVLLTPQARRRYGGRLFFGLSTFLLNALRQTEQSGSQSEQPFTKIELRNANTTKETQTKHYLPNGRERHPGRSSIATKKSPVKQAHPTQTGIQHSHTEPPNPDVRRFLYAYRTLFQEHTRRGEPPVIEWGKDGKLVKSLLKLYSYERLIDLLEQFFQSHDQWIRRTGYSLAAFKTVIGQLLVSEATRAPLPRDPMTVHTNGWSKAGERLPDRYRRQEDT